MYRLIALDLDGTLLNSNHDISDVNRAAICEAVKHGVSVVLASARPYRSVVPAAEKLGLSDVYLIAAGGSDVRLYPSGTIVYRASLSPNEVRLCVDFCHRYNQYFQAFRIDGSYYFEKRTDFSDAYESVFHYSGEETDFTKWKYDDCCKVMVISPDDEADPVHESAQKELNDQFLVVKSWYNMTEFHPLAGGKAGALSAISQAAGIPREEIIAVGDDTIDLPMLQWAGLGVAMGNAPDTVKSAADWVAPTNEEDGVAAVIRKFILD